MPHGIDVCEFDVLDTCWVLKWVADDWALDCVKVDKLEVVRVGLMEATLFGGGGRFGQCNGLGVGLVAVIIPWLLGG